LIVAIRTGFVEAVFFHGQLIDCDYQIFLSKASMAMSGVFDVQWQMP
jgi:hypothetical protein